jgi:type I restriction enzyme R subunit
MNSKHLERAYEEELVTHLTQRGWLEGDAALYDRTLALYPTDLIGWLQETQPQEWQKLAAGQNGDSQRLLLERVVKLMDTEGSLAVLRHGFKYLNARFQLCQFKPGHRFNPETLARYEKVRCRVVRQVHYSLHNEKSIDLVLFVNGVPVATLELKTDFTQSIGDAIRQYKQDRWPKDPGAKAEEPLLAFKRRALVHFAVSTDEVYMATKLAGAETYCLPFNLGHDQGAGNPPNPAGYRTSYLWERILEREAWLDIIGRFVHLEKKTGVDEFGRKSSKETLVFPRFHQREVVTRLVAAARAEGAGQRYLVQHSAGSGKSNSIAWLAHQLASLHDDSDRKVFDSVIVITDRTVLDKQLQETIYQIDHKEGVVVRVTDQEVKSHQLIRALIERAPIIIVTIQTFPFVLESIQQQISLKERSFAVIADEAHSSQSGGTITKLKQVLTAEQIEEGEEVSAEEMMVAAMAARTPPANVSFFAFTATPKAKTLELFGRKGANGIPEPFHVYSMQQAIEEGFILDVLKNYLPYKLAYKLAHKGKSYDEAEIDQSEGLKQLARWVRENPYNIRSKVTVIVEHFRAKIAWQLNGEAKAMVVTSSRKEAVRYKLAMARYLKEQGYKLGVLVAFSGEVNDGESGPAPFSETNMNDLRGQELRSVFDGKDFQILIVANKYQTGFDQPKLVAMYVDKRLAGVAAVQTLSRLNRTMTGKTDTFVLDFVNDPGEILAAFVPYYRTAQLADVSDPNVIHDLQAKLDGAHIYTRSEVESFARAYFDPKGKQELLQAYIAPAVDRFRDRYVQAKEEHDRTAQDALDIFRKDLGTFVRAYEFLSQIFAYDDPDLEKQHVFSKHLIPWLKTDADRTLLDLSTVELTHYRLQELEKQRLLLRETDGGEYKLKPMTEAGTATAHDPHLTTLQAIIEQMNELFAGDLSEADLVTYVQHITGKMLENDLLAKQAASNSKEQFSLGDFSGVLVDTIIDGLDSYRAMAEQVLGNDATRKGFERLVLDLVYRGFEQGRQGRAAASG